jgi:phenylacetate-coenzyme A ligase PaaK-like adenylate-forming protein
VDVLTRSSLTEKVAAARARLDAHVREIVAWHFDPQTGSPFWLERAAGLGFDPRKEVRGYDDLALFGHFEDSCLRGGPVRRWIPRGLAGRPAYVFETGGSTGVPKSRVNIEDFQIDYERFSDELPEAGFPAGSDWLMLGPTGPRRLRLSVEHLAQHRGGICFHVDLDPRWVNKLIKLGRFRELEEYKAHVIEQGLTVLRAHEIRCLFTTPKLLAALCERVSLVKLGIRGIFCGGTEMNAQFNRFAREELVPGIEFVPTYGNTLMGLACPKPFDPADSSPDQYTITYYPPAPRAVFELVDPKNPERPVEYGQTGRVMLTTLTRDFFMPRFLERDEAEREKPCGAYPWDGVRNVRPFSRFATTVVEGVY